MEFTTILDIKFRDKYRLTGRLTKIFCFINAIHFIEQSVFLN